MSFHLEHEERRAGAMFPHQLQQRSVLRSLDTALQVVRTVAIETTLEDLRVVIPLDVDGQRVGDHSVLR